jgi:hypothetical protein
MIRDEVQETWSTDRSKVESHIIPYFLHVARTCDHVTEELIQGTAASSASDRPISDTPIMHTHQPLSQMLSHAMLRRRLIYNLARDVHSAAAQHPGADGVR